MGQTDQVLARYVNEIEDRQQFIDSLLESANGDDLSDEKMELVTRAKDRISEVNRLMGPLEEARRISGESAERVKKLAEYMAQKPDAPKAVEYRSAGEYITDYIQARTGVSTAARERLEIYQRAAAHQTTTDNPGLLPEQILGPVVNFVDTSRPLVSALGPRQLPSGSWSRPLVTQHTNVAAQSAEKAELVSRKMTITKLPVTATTYGGYVNVSRQDIDWTNPQIMDIVVNDLAGQYAIQTEDAAAVAFEAAATAGATGLGTTPTAEEVAAALWGAAGACYTATAGAGRLICVAAPNMLSLIGPLFAPVNPQNAQSTGFTAGSFGTGIVGAVSGITIYVSAAITAGVALVMSTAAAEVYEDRVGALQVIEPSVLGVQVAYAGYFAPLVIEDAAIIKLTAA